MLTFVIEGNPIPWKAHGGYGKKSFNPLYKEREYVQWKVKSQLPNWFEILDEAVILQYTFFVPTPKMSMKKSLLALSGAIRPTKKPDCSNFIKFYEDCLKKVVITDDSLVVGFSCNKYYSDNPRTEISIETISLDNTS